MIRTFAFLFIFFSATIGPAGADYALRDGDTVVFLGDSITAARTYGKIVENYTLLRFPDRKVKFVNSGWGGDTASGGLKRLEKDVFAHGATVLIVAYGVNDIGWGTKADAEHRQTYLDSIRGIIEACKKRGVRVFIASAAITAEDPDKAENGFLQSMCDDGMALSRSLGEGSIDVQRTMRAIQRNVRKANESTPEKDRASLHVADGVHLSDLGQLTMAYAILKGLGAPKEVSSVRIDLAKGNAVEASGCRVSHLEATSNRVTFERKDDGLPINFGVFGALQFRYIPIPDEIDRYMLQIVGLPDGEYDLFADDRGLGHQSAAQLARGVNLCSATADGWEPGGPWDAQAGLLIHLTDARTKVAEGRLLSGHYLPRHPELSRIRAEADEADRRIVEFQRTLVRPRGFRFEVRARRSE